MYQTALVQKQNNFAEMFLIMISIKIALMILLRQTSWLPELKINFKYTFIIGKLYFQSTCTQASLQWLPICLFIDYVTTYNTYTFITGELYFQSTCTQASLQWLPICLFIDYVTTYNTYTFITGELYFQSALYSSLSAMAAYLLSYRLCNNIQHIHIYYW